MQIIKKIIKLSSTATAKNTYLVFGGNALAGFLGMISMILVSRFLGPESFGIFSVAFSLATLLIKFGDLGFNFAMVKNISQSRIKKENKRIPRIFLTVFWVKCLISLFLMVIGLISVKYISVHIFNSPASYFANILVISFFILDVFYDTLRVYFEANKKFVDSVLMYAVANLVKIPAIILFFKFSPLFKELIIVYLFAPFIASLIFYPKTKLKLKFFFDKLEFQKLIKFSSWMGVSVILAALGENLNIFMVSAKLSSFETGIYSAAEKFILPFYIFSAALSTVLVPRASEFMQLSHIKAFIKKIFVLQLGLLIMIIIIYPLTNLLPVFLGKAYFLSVPVLKILVVGSFFRMAITPLNSVFYPLEKSIIFAIDAVIQVGLLFFLNSKMLSIFHAEGAALSLLIVNVVIFLFNYIFLAILLRKVNKGNLDCNLVI